MSSLAFLYRILFVSSLSLFSAAFAQGTKDFDQGKHITGIIKGTLIFAGPTTKDVDNIVLLDGKLRSIVVSESKFKAEELYKIGTDKQDVYKAYQSWLKPLEGSDKFMINCEPKARLKNGQKMVVNFWVDNKKVFSTDTILIKYKTPLIIMGPSWRGGKILMAVELER